VWTYTFSILGWRDMMDSVVGVVIMHI
jgi:hypothetical protein